MAKVLVVDDNKDCRTLLSRLLKEMIGCEVVEAENGQGALEQVREHSPDLMILDLFLPDSHGIDILAMARQIKADLVVAVLTAHGDHSLILELGRAGVWKIFLKGQDPLDKIIRDIGMKLAETSPGPMTAGWPDAKDIPSSLWATGESSAIKRAVSQASRIAGDDSTVVIEGEEGTRKQDVAWFIHQHSPRSARPFVVVDCWNFPDAHAKYILYGYVESAVKPGDQRRDGYFREAEGGSLLFHRISHLSLETQAMIAGIMMERSIRPVGSGREHKVDVRIMATSTSSLSDSLREGCLLEDLFRQLNPCIIKMPALCDRVQDIPILVEKCMLVAGNKHSKKVDSVSESALRLLQLHCWPWNLNELYTVVEQAVLKCQGSCIALADISLRHPPEPAQSHLDISCKDHLESIERRRMQDALCLACGNVSKAARHIQMPKTTFHRKQQKYGLK